MLTANEHNGGFERNIPAALRFANNLECKFNCGCRCTGSNLVSAARELEPFHPSDRFGGYRHKNLTDRMAVLGIWAGHTGRRDSNIGIAAIRTCHNAGTFGHHTDDLAINRADRGE